MLSKELKREVQHWYIYTCYAREKNGKPVASDGKLAQLPTYPEIVDRSIKELSALAEKQQAGVYRVHPTLANCILRVFSTYHHHHEDGIIYNIYGACCFMRHGGGWISSWGGQDSKIDFARFSTKRWLCQDDSVTFNHDFVDIYLNIS